MANGKRLTRRLVIDQGISWSVPHGKCGTLVGAPQKCPLGHILTCYDGSQPQYPHLRASMLAYAHINLLSMLSGFTPDEAVRLATDSIYVRKSALKRLEGVEAFIHMKKMRLRSRFAREKCLPAVTPAQWRDKDEELYMPVEHAAYLAKPDYKAAKKDLTPSTAPGHDDPLSRHRLSYLSGGGGSGKTTRAIELFRQRDPLDFTPTHRLAKEMRARGVQAQTYHSFFRWSCQTEWTPERIGRKLIPLVIIWDEVCTVPRPTLETFLDWLEGRGVQVICCGDQGQPPPITGEWLLAVAQQPANYYEEVEVDHRAKDPLLKALKKRIRLQPEKVQCQEIRKALPGFLGWERFVEALKPCDLILTSRLKVRDQAQKLLFKRHEEYFPDTSVPLLYRSEDTRRQDIKVTTPGPLLLDGKPDKRELVLNDVVEVPLIYAREVLGGKWGPD